MITTILFDIDGVLIDSFAANFEFYNRLFTKTGYKPLTKKQYIPLFQLPMIGVIQTVTKTTDQKEIERLMKIGKEREGIYPYNLIQIPDAREATLKELAAHYSLGIVTSRLKNFIFDIPQLHAIKKYFTLAVGFEDTKNHKPHPDPLLFAMKQLHVTPQETVYIGDQPADVLAARAANIQVLLYAKTEIEKPDFFTSSFSSIPNLLKGK